jgi:hypothetical protein
MNSSSSVRGENGQPSAGAKSAPDKTAAMLLDEQSMVRSCMNLTGCCESQGRAVFMFTSREIEKNNSKSGH